MANIKDNLYFHYLVLRYGLKDAETRMMKILMRRRGMLDVELMDTLDGKFSTETNNDGTWILFGEHRFNISTTDNYESIPIWIHEFTEHAIGHLILHILVYDDFTANEIRRYIDNILLQTECGMYKSKMKHLLAALCTESSLDEITINGDECALVFGIEKGKKPEKLLKIKSTNPFECMFERMLKKIHKDLIKYRY